MKPEIAYKHLFPACKALFPERADLMSAEACAELLAIGMQESDFAHRQQLTGGIRDWWRSLTGPAASYWQIERAGIKGVMQHHRTRPMLQRALEKLGYPEDLETIWSAIRYDNILAVVVARLILFQYPGRLPLENEPSVGWSQYFATWRPGKPKPEKWAACYRTAWDIVRGRV